MVEVNVLKTYKRANELTSIIYECKIVATELIIESTHGLQIVVLMYNEPIELDLRSSRCSWLVSGVSRLGALTPL